MKEYKVRVQVSNQFFEDVEFIDFISKDRSSTCSLVIDIEQAKKLKYWLKHNT